MENISDKQGRALEYVIVEEITKKMPQNKGRLTRSARIDQDREKAKFEACSFELQKNYKKFPEIVFEWLKNNFQIDLHSITIDRLSDTHGKKGDVTDIRIYINEKVINLSIKHKHKALKHQRPPTTAVRCGFPPKSIQDNIFRKQYEDITDIFLEQARDMFPEATKFNEIKKIQNDFINKNLYLPVCNHVADFINSHCKAPRNVIELFTFLVGKTNFYKIIDFRDEIHIYKFYEIKLPESVKAETYQDSYVILYFSNGWVISMRLHTAASILGKSLKFDTQPVNLEEMILKEIIKK